MELELKNICVNYDKTEILKGVSLQINKGEAVSLMGSNGAGKTTALRAVSGLKKLTSGEIWFEGKRIDKHSPSDIVKLGIVQVPEGKRLFPSMRVYENLLMGAYLREDKEGVKKSLEEIYGHFQVLGARKGQRARTLSGGEQQMLAIGRALMARPKVLLLDEPSIGLSPLMVVLIAKIIVDISRGGMTVLLVEQNAHLALNLTQRGYIIVRGRIVQEGNTVDLKKNDYIKKAYLEG